MARSNGRPGWLIDVDTGSDDAVALLMALRSPEIEVLGVTVVAGNVPVDVGLANTLRVLDLAGAPASLPVAAGADRPLLEPLRPSTHIHGDDGLCGWEQPPSARSPEPRPAASFIVDTVMASPEPVTLVALAPLTNLALALRIQPAIGRRIERLVVMGGSADGMGNMTAAAEFNFGVDPEAARIVFESGLPITLVGLDACRPTALPVARAAEWRHDVNPRRRFLADQLDYFGGQLGRTAVAIYDAVAVAVALRPDLATIRRLSAVVETAPGYHRGAVLVDRRPHGRRDPDWPELDVVVGVDVAAYHRLLLERLA